MDGLGLGEPSRPLRGLLDLSGARKIKNYLRVREGKGNKGRHKPE
jgi:hypothetical protein